MTALRLMDDFEDDPFEVAGADPLAPSLEDRRAQQIAEAEARLDADYTGQPTWNRPALDAITGPLLPGELWIILAREKNGKTSFITNAMVQFERQGHGVMYFGTEEQAAAAQLRYASIMTGHCPGDITAGEFGPEPEETKREIRDALRRIAKGRTHFADATRPTIGDIRRAADEAVERKMSFLVLDHFSRLAVSEGRDKTAAITEAVRQIKEVTTQTQLRIVMMAQAKRGATQLAKYMPPPADGGLGTSALEQEANVLLGLYRPFKPGQFTASSVRQFESGMLSESDLLMPNTMGIKTLAHRRMGDLIGSKCHLHIERGIVANKIVSDAPVYGGTT